MRAAANRAWLTISVLVAIFAAIAISIHSGAAAGFDRDLLLSMRRGSDLKLAGPHWLHQSALDITSLGSDSVLWLGVAATAILLALDRRERVAVFLSGCVASGYLLMRVLKTAFDRPRPGVVPHLVSVSGASFPSGHAMMSAITYLTLAAIFARILSERTERIDGSARSDRSPAAVAVWILAAALVLLIGCTRLYLGVHWPTDVLGGWVAGGAWVMICRRLAGVTGEPFERQDSEA